MALAAANHERLRDHGAEDPPPIPTAAGPTHSLVV